MVFVHGVTTRLGLHTGACSTYYLTRKPVKFSCVRLHFVLPSITSFGNFCIRNLLFFIDMGISTHFPITLPHSITGNSPNLLGFPITTAIPPVIAHRPTSQPHAPILCLTVCTPIAPLFVYRISRLDPASWL